MSFEIAPIDVWVSEIRNRPGELANILNELDRRGAHLELIVGRPGDAGSSAVFIAPLMSDDEIATAVRLGFHRSESMHVVRVAGPDAAGLGARVTQIVADAKLNLKAISGAAIQSRSLLYLRFDSPTDSARAVEALKSALRPV